MRLRSSSFFLNLMCASPGECVAGMEMRKLVEMLAEMVEGLLLLGFPSNHCSQAGLISFLEHFFDLPDLLFNFASVLFGFALSLQVGVVRVLACRLFDFAFRFVKIAFDLILCARVHLFSPYCWNLASLEERNFHYPLRHALAT